jgi:hypothetical protein
MCWGHANLLCIVSLLTICPEAKDGLSIAAIKMEFGQIGSGRVAWRLCRMARRRRVTCGAVDLDFADISPLPFTARFTVVIVQRSHQCLFHGLRGLISIIAIGDFNLN